MLLKNVELKVRIMRDNITALEWKIEIQMNFIKKMNYIKMHPLVQLQAEKPLSGRDILIRHQTNKSLKSRPRYSNTSISLPLLQTWGLKLTEISWVSGSLLTNGRLRLYWELSPTDSVHASYRLLEHLELQAQGTQTKYHQLSQENHLYLFRQTITSIHIPIKWLRFFFHLADGRENGSHCRN